MAITRSKAKSRRDKGSFTSIPHSYMTSEAMCQASGKAYRLVIFLSSQLRFDKQGIPKNNGNLCATWSMAKKQGFRSQETLSEAIKECLHLELIVRTRQGARLNKSYPSLYAVTFLSLGTKVADKQLDVSLTFNPRGKWMGVKSKYLSKRKK